MIPLPPGCTVSYNITIEIDALTEEMVQWYEMIGGQVNYVVHMDWRGREKRVPRVSYGKGKQSYNRQDGSNGHRLHFQGDDASVASMFMIKFLDHVQQHNFKEIDDRKQQSVGAHAQLG